MIFRVLKERWLTFGFSSSDFIDSELFKLVSKVLGGDKKDDFKPLKEDKLLFCLNAGKFYLDRLCDPVSLPYAKSKILPWLAEFVFIILGLYPSPAASICITFWLYPVNLWSIRFGLYIAPSNLWLLEYLFFLSFLWLRLFSNLAIL